MRRWIAGALGVLSLAGGYCAAVPPRMHYQGKLTDPSGKLTADGGYDMVFALYDAETGGNQEWTETWDSGASRVQVSGGLFNVLLGSHMPVALPFDENYWLEIRVKYGGAYETLSPRQQIASGAYAFRADEADDVKDGVVTLSKLDLATIPGLDSEGYSTFPIPSVTGIIPSLATAGYSSFTATITGENFPRISPRAKIGATALENANALGAGEMTATVPGGLAPGTYDVLVSGIGWDWGTGGGLFAVITPTPTPTPTATRTATPTPTPTPWDAAVCAAAGGHWAADNLGGNGCWFVGDRDETCNTVCGHASLACDSRNWDDSASCDIARHWHPGIACAKTEAACRYNSPSYHDIGDPYMAWYRDSDTGQDCAAVPCPNCARFCVCKP